MTGDSEASRRRLRRRRILAAIALASVALLVVVGVRWWTHPHVFEDLSAGVSMDPRPVPRAALSTGIVFPQADGDAETVMVDGLDAVFTTNSARADATFWICHPSPGDTQIGAVHNPAGSCADIEPAHADQEFRLGTEDGDDYIFVTITPTTAGVAHVTSVVIDYRRGASHLWQHGSQTFTVDAKITAT